MTAAKLLIEVTVGLAPDMPIEEKCRRWCYTSDDQEADRKIIDTVTDEEHDTTRYTAMCREALTYAGMHMDPSQHNFVRLDWIWL